MDELPFLVVHGQIVAMLLVLAVAAIACVPIRWVRRALDRRRARRDVRVRARTATALAEGGVALHAVWREAGGRCWLDVGGEPVDLEGELRVVRGTRARWRWRDPRPVHQLCSGDEVLACGQLSRRGDGAAAEASYRQPGGRWALGPGRVLAQIELYALAPAACPAPLRGLGVLLFAAFAVGAFASLHEIGRTALHDGWYGSHWTMDGLRAWDPVVIAAAVPTTRDDALQVLSRRFEDESVRTPGNVERSLALAGLRGCEAELDALIVEGRFDEAATRAAACGSAQWQARALVLAGRFDEAATIAARGGVSSHVAGAASLAAGRWSVAASALDQRVAASGTVDALPTLRHLGCLADAFRVHGGELTAAVRLHARARQPLYAGCKVDEALLLPIDHQAAALAEARAGLDATPELARAVDLLLWTLRGEPAKPTRFASSLLDRRHPASGDQLDDAREAWLVPFARHGSPRSHAWWAVHHVLAGDWQAAHAAARQLHDALTGDDGRWFDPQELDLEVQLREGVPRIELDRFADHARVHDQHAGDDEQEDPEFQLQEGIPLSEHAGVRPTPASDFAVLRLGFASSELDDDFASYVHWPRQPARLALAAAMHGDGGPLADAVEHTGAPWSQAAALLLALAPGVTTGRAQLSTALRALSGPATADLFGFLWSLAMRRDLARVAGDDATAARDQAILDRYREMLADRDRLIAFLLLAKVWGGPDMAGWFP